MKCHAASRASITNEPAGNQFCVRAKRGPRPAIAIAFGLLFGRSVFSFAADEAPNLIALNPLALEIAKSFVLILGAGAANVDQQLCNGILRYTSHSNRVSGDRKSTRLNSSHV